MTSTFKVVLLVGILIYFYVIVRLLKKKRLILKYSLLWIVLGVIMIILVIFPQMLRAISTLLGIEDTMNGLFTCAIGLVLMILMALTAIVSKQSDRIKNLVQDNALLEKRLRDMVRKNLIEELAVEENKKEQ